MNELNAFHDGGPTFEACCPDPAPDCTNEPDGLSWIHVRLEGQSILHLSLLGPRLELRVLIRRATGAQVATAGCG